MTPEHDSNHVINRHLLARLFNQLIVSTEHFYRGDPCWEWVGVRDKDGYGSVQLKSISTNRAHRVFYILFVGDIPPGLVLDHLCRLTSCVNPAHVEPVTNTVNILRGNGAAAINARKTHCIHGHALAGDNLQINKGKRACRICGREAGRQYRQRAEDKANGLPLDHPERIKFEERKEVNRKRSREQSKRKHANGPRQQPRTHCRNGHALSPDNLVKLKNPNRKECLTCRREKGRRDMRLRYEKEGKVVGLPMKERTHCPKGHEYSGSNLVVYKTERLCRTCRNAASLRYAQKKSQNISERCTE